MCILRIYFLCLSPLFSLLTFAWLNRPLLPAVRPSSVSVWVQVQQVWQAYQGSVSQAPRRHSVSRLPSSSGYTAFIPLKSLSLIALFLSRAVPFLEQIKRWGSMHSSLCCHRLSSYQAPSPLQLPHPSLALQQQHQHLSHQTLIQHRRPLVPPHLQLLIRSCVLDAKSLGHSLLSSVASVDTSSNCTSSPRARLASPPFCS